MMPDCKGLRVPKCILQPLVENSIIHSQTEISDDSHIQIKIIVKRYENIYEIRVEDNGTNCDVEKINAYLCNGDKILTENGMGIKNVNVRINLTYGTTSNLRFEKTASGETAAVIRIQPS
jgi:two-component system sensor histidine kinase YesM